MTGRTQIPGRQILDGSVKTADIENLAVTDDKLSNTGAPSGTFTKLTINSKGRVIAAENPTTLEGYGITDAAPASPSYITANSEITLPNERSLVGTPNQIVLTDNGGNSTLQIGLAQNLNISSVDWIDFNPISTPTHLEGRVYYDTVEKALTVYDNVTGTSVQLGHESVLRVKNMNAQTITNGTVVYINGSSGDFPTVSPALANSDITSRVIGVATHDIPFGVEGKVTIRGVINGLDTSMYLPGDLVWLSDTVAGTFTTTKPIGPANAHALVGVIIRSHINAGKLLVQTYRLSAQGIYDALGGEPNLKNENIPVTQLNNGSNANDTTFWRGDGGWFTAVTSVGLTASAGLEVTGSPVTTSGNISLQLADDLASIEALSTTGLAVRTAGDTWALRTLTQPPAGLSITNPAGIAGNPTFSLANDLAAIEALASTGFAVRTGTDTWSNRTLVDTVDQIIITNPSGVVGNPTIAIANNPIIPGTASMTLPSGTSIQAPTPIPGMVRFNSTKSRIETAEGGVWGPTGTVKQFVTGSFNNVSFNNQIPYDNTTPLITEGFQLFSIPFTPLFADSIILVTVTSFYTVASSSDVYATGAIFVGSTCVAAQMLGFTTNNGNGSSFVVSGALPSPGTTEVAVQFRAGPNINATMHMGQGTSGQAYGSNLLTSEYIIWEIRNV